MKDAVKALREIDDICTDFFRAEKIEFTFSSKQFSVKGNDMTFTMQANQDVTVNGAPVDANGNPSTASLSNISYSSSDSTVFTVAADPNTPGGAIITGVGAGTATLTETATATEANGTSEQITGSATIVLTAAGTGPASLVFTFGSPTNQ